ncbi:MAG: tRNA (adenosine(37)-N6)-threonylcarbamoyltransferase complex transferase subunit TsaD [Omnitrophica WOR_2 bacterium GWF2_43_52]|nr:MAG: tRNA (adenosine(37)-N6)-threonylcarbamoyltransferase complex transferase subunit TsaD [Omnitrophica WOR_2 bacterium GWA2_44_7]OGX18158.1 MAG: tRNA (adenosine(37)-N6)-threonylcarbamoyltransferase complex transferase subunit TsaD [Omnitrophica WOR_2 bacterium GWC2_44_8]OGX20974.1 MAG: tRNA (adenosine(37)-N6)-threonylcarbamoyltransferase complex transferase subunit TsaD [Omnitrophica WOR_2 bacterium GWF2_43_52]OGX56815.1 MAG: tRNA (adenosine(37)-N6)-threonylcarbamoyltransferase complex tran
MIILGIETSCDETSAAVVENGRYVLSNVVSSSLRLHQKYKGIIPEIASRAHIESLSLVVKDALRKARKKITDIGLVCVTKGPGLVGSLLVGISFAKALSFATKKTLVGVDHLEAHLYASFLAKDKKQGCGFPALPCVGLVVSGGHTSLFLISKDFDFKGISQTADDAAGEAFDKVAKILDLGYPGGPVIEKMARQGNPESVKLSCGTSDDLGFSFSGIKTAVLYQVTRSQGHKVTNKDLAASFQKTVVEALVEKSLLACERRKIATLVVGGGVAANSYLRSRMEEEARLKNVDVFFPDFALSLDNAAMIAGLGYQLYKRGKRSNYYLGPELS